MKKNLLLIIGVLFLASCTAKKSNHTIDDPAMKADELLTQVRKAINPKFKNWVLFSNGTYIILEDTVQDKKQVALDLIKEYGPVYVGSPAGDFSVITLNQIEGWSVTSHYEGMYTYVNPSELDKQTPTDIELVYMVEEREKKTVKR